MKHYEFKVRDSEQINALIALFARIESDKLQIPLSPLAEPTGLSWLTSLPAGNGTAVLFSIGDQSVIDQ